MSRIITNVIDQAAVFQAQSLKTLWPSWGNNGLHEQNLTFNMGFAFKTRPRSGVFPEIPFRKLDGERYDNHIDCLMFDPNIIIFLESKRLYKAQGLRSLQGDYERMNAGHLLPVIERMKNYSPARAVYRLLMAETWQQNVADIWLGNAERETWDVSWLDGSTAGSKEVWTSSANETLTWLYAFEQIAFD